MDANQDNDKTQIASIEKNKSKNSTSKLHLIGKKLSDRYLIEELIGQGGMSYIYRARDTYLEHEHHKEHLVAIKVLQEEYSASEEAITLLKDETLKTQQLSHPNIVKVFSAEFDGAQHYVTMEWVDGETLEQLIKRNKPSGLTFVRAKIILKQLVNALTYAHDKGVIHNDLKPSNIMFDANGNLKILDFGIAKQRDNEDEYAAPHNNVELTGGYTPTYASPAQLDGKEATVKDDIYSLACITYELLTSKHPYNRTAANSLAKETMVKKPKNCPMWFWPSLKHALLLDETKRSGSLKQIFNSLEKDNRPIIAFALASLVAFSCSFYYFNANNIQQQKLAAQLSNATAINEQVETWMSWKGNSLLERLSEIPPQYQVLKQGLLRVNQEKLIDHFELQASQVQRISNRTKNFDDIIAIYNKAIHYFPDSKTLSQKLDSILTERQSILSNITYRIDLLLEQSRYDKNEQNSIISLMQHLHEVDDNFVYQPKDSHFENFQQAVQQAIESDDFSAQKNLLDTAKAVFSDYVGAEAILAIMLERESSIAALASYNEKLSRGEEVSYPTADALVFYKHKFTRFEKQLAEISNYKDLLEFEAVLNEQSNAFPDTFAPLISIRKEISKRYISMATDLMKKKMYRTAEKLVGRSEAISKDLEGKI
ncbi:serine/threonine-protein kinase [Pseudoalteromonas mariniglutinosa]|uniref:serine/threonine-protein kinase n=1 Tax=Pseudoalteromonas mariniglutinosa TaxID=206042 RepID=UPI00384A89A1